MTAQALAVIEDDEQTEFTFDQLCDSAKDKARDAFREHHLDYDWWEWTFDDADTIAEMLGIAIKRREVRLMNGKTRQDPAIYFSGFWSQGDGACFEGNWQPEAPMGILDKVMAHAPQDADLHEIAFEFAHLSERCADWEDVNASISHSGNYYHSYSANIDVEFLEPDEFDDWDEVKQMIWQASQKRNDMGTFEADVADALRSFMNWIYSRLEDEYDYLMSDEAIDEYLMDEDRLFDEDGDEL